MSAASPPGNPKSPAGQRTAQASPVGAAPTPASKQAGSFPASSIAPSTSSPSIIRFESLPRAYVSSSSSTAVAGGQRAAGGHFSTHQQQNEDAADAALYRDMREALADFEARQQQLARQPASTSQRTSSRPARMPPRQTAFYSALRSVLQQVLAESTPAGRHTRLLAAHAWYVGHRPRAIPADPGLAAALAASLSISTPAGQQQPQQQQQDCPQSLPAGTAAGGRGSSASACGRWPPATAAGCDCDGGAGCDDFFVGCEDGAGWPGSPQDAACPACSSSQHQQHASPQNSSSRVAASTAASLAGASGGGGALLFASKLEDAAQTAFSSSWQPPSGRGSNGGSSRSGADAAAEVPGLIPVGCLPSSRFACSSSAQGSEAAVAAAAAGAAPRTSSCSGHHADQQQQQQWQQQWQQRQQWSAVSAQQAVLEAQVASGMRGFARQRARIEEDISMRQELAAVAAATATAAAAGAAGAFENGTVHEGGRSSDGIMGQPGVRFLQHMDSQHQPSQVTVEHTRAGAGAGVLAGKAATAADGCSGPGGGVQLLVMDRVKAARKQHLQEGVQECSLLQQKLGVSNEVLSRALLPVPDVPYMSAFGQLPTYTPAAKAGAASRKKSGKKAKAKGKKNKKGAEVAGSRKVGKVK